jgi:hypothetical protein
MSTEGYVSRHEAAKTLGRRVSRGEFERVFSQLKVQHIATGKPGKSAEILVRHEDSPKAKRKKAERNARP